MINQLFGLPESPLWIFASIIGGGIGLFLVLATLSYFLFFVWGRRTFHPDYRKDVPEIREAIKWSVIAAFGNAVLISPIHWALANGHGKIYFDVAEHGWGWIFASAILMVCMSETIIYFVHRTLHWGPFYRRLHYKHHEFKVPTPYVGLAFRPLDAFAQGLPHHICAFLFPVHAGVYLVSVTMVTVWAVMIHDRVSFVRWKGINYTGHHTLHHWYETGNFGQYFTFWDRVMGTYYDPEIERADVPEGIVVRAQDAIAARDRAAAGVQRAA